MIRLDYDAIRRTFLAEADESVATMEEALVGLEACPGDRERVQTLLRVIHSLKGNAFSLGLRPLADLAHATEEVLVQAREQAAPAGSGMVGALLEVVDTLRGMLRALAAGEEVSAAQPALIERLAALLASPASGEETPPREGTVPAAAVEAPAAAPAELDVRSRTLRVDLDKLDRLLNLTGEIAILRGRERQILEKDPSAAGKEALDAHREVDRLYADLQEVVMKARMVPVGPAFRPHLRTVRDVAEAQGKRAALAFEGEDVEVDTKIIEQMRDPLTHLVRNAVVHGIETPEARRAAGKDPCGRVTLRARHDAGCIVIEVSDDGAGLDRRGILARARALGMVRTESLTDREIEAILFEPGFSTTARVTDLSGRGVGLDVVRRNVEALRGSVGIESQAGAGTTLALRLPLTLAMIQGFAVGVADESYLIPMDAIRECLELPREEAGQAEGCGVLNVRGRPLPYVRLRHHFGLPGRPPAREYVVMVSALGERAGIAVDRLLGENQTVIKPLGGLFGNVPGVAGSAILGDGRVALILDVPRLMQNVLERKVPA